MATCAFEAAGARVVHVPVDRDGLDPARFPNGRPPARLAYVTPSHQFPTGAVMPVARRHALVEWARRARAFVFEDDYDGEFRYAGQPIPALAGLDPDAVIYCGTFSKSLFPACRMGYLVLPPSLVGAALTLQMGFGPRQLPADRTRDCRAAPLRRLRSPHPPDAAPLSRAA